MNTLEWLTEHRDRKERRLKRLQENRTHQKQPSTKAAFAGWIAECERDIKNLNSLIQKHEKYVQ